MNPGIFNKKKDLAYLHSLRSPPHYPAALASCHVPVYAGNSLTSMTMVISVFSPTHAITKSAQNEVPQGCNQAFFSPQSNVSTGIQNMVSEIWGTPNMGETGSRIFFLGRSPRISTRECAKGCPSLSIQYKLLQAYLNPQLPPV